MFFLVQYRRPDSELFVVSAADAGDAALAYDVLQTGREDHEAAIESQANGDVDAYQAALLDAYQISEISVAEVADYVQRRLNGDERLTIHI